MKTWLIRLTGVENWDALGAGWLDRAEKVADLRWIESWMDAPQWLPNRDRARIDLDAGGAFLYVVEKGEIHALLGRPPSDRITDEWEQQLELLEALDSGYRYAVVWIGEEQVSSPGKPNASPSIDRQIYIQPDWPDGEFNLMALDEGWGVGAFTKDGWEAGPDGTLWAAPDGAHPVTLRVRKQEGNLIHANNGDMGTMTYRIVPCEHDQS